MKKQEYEKFEQAANVLCSFCENDECEKCQVNILLNEAYVDIDDEE